MPIKRAYPYTFYYTDYYRVDASGKDLYTKNMYPYKGIPYTNDSRFHVDLVDAWIYYAERDPVTNTNAPH